MFFSTSYAPGISPEGDNNESLTKTFSVRIQVFSSD